jgi:hypothetical protein
MRSMLRRFRFVPGLLLLVPGCVADSPVEPQTPPPSLLIGPPPGCAFQYLSSGILEPINADGSSSYQLGRTLPVKIRITDCVSGAAVNDVEPQVALALVDLGGGPVNELESSSAADEGTTLRPAGNGQYIFNLSTKRSQFNAGDDLRPGVYQLTVSLSGMQDVVVQFAIRP